MPISETKIGLASLLVLSIIFLSTAGCIEEGDEPYDGSCIPPFPEEFFLHHEECYMSGVDRWDANYSVDNTYRESEWPVSGVEIPGRLTEGTGLYAANFTYVDADTDGLVNTGDYILFSNLSESDLIHYNLTCNGELLVCFEIIWDDEDWKNYLVRATWVNESLEPDGFYSAEITLWLRDGVTGPWWWEFRIGFLSVHGTVLPHGRMTHNDSDRDKRISEGDTISVTGLTYDHHNSMVQFIHENKLVGWTYIRLPDA